MTRNDADDRLLTTFRTAIPWRAAAPWGIALAGTFLIREALDILQPTTDFGLRSLTSTWVAFMICFCAGFQTAWRDKSERRLHVWHGSRVALTAIVVSFLIAIVGDVSVVFMVSAFHALDLQQELYWAVEIPLPVMLVIGGLVGTGGAATATGLRFRRRAILQS